MRRLTIRFWLEAALGARAVDGHAGRAEVVGQHLGGDAGAHARRVQERQRSGRLGGERGGRGARLLAPAVGQPEVAGVARGLTVAQQPDLGHQPASVSSYRLRTDPIHSAFGRRNAARGAGSRVARTRTRAMSVVGAERSRRRSPT